MRKITTSWTSSSWGTSEAKTGGFRRMFMEMEAQVLVEKRDMACGLILLRISITTAFSGLRIRSCKQETSVFLFWLYISLFCSSLSSYERDCDLTFSIDGHGCSGRLRCTSIIPLPGLVSGRSFTLRPRIQMRFFSCGMRKMLHCCVSDNMSCTVLGFLLFLGFFFYGIPCSVRLWLGHGFAPYLTREKKMTENPMEIL